jgi:large subunit ribosomal protein L15
VAEESASAGLNLHDLAPAPGSHRERKRVGRGPGSGKGKTSGRGQKGQKSRSGSHRMRPGFEGGQMPLYMRVGKLRGPNNRTSMPMGPFRTHTTPVNVGALERFDAGTEVTPELLADARLVRRKRTPIKILGDGELTKKLTVHAHGFSKRAIEVIEAAGGSVVRLGPVEEEQPAAKPKQVRRASRKPADSASDDAPETKAAAADEPDDSANDKDEDATDDASEE